MGMYAIKTPDIGEGIAEVELVAWRVKPGEAVQEDQVLADVMTDKATVEIPSPVAGTVVALNGEPGQVVAVGSELVRLEVAGAGNVKDAGSPHPGPLPQAGGGRGSLSGGVSLPQGEGGRGSPSVGVSGTLSRERERVGVRVPASHDVDRDEEDAGSPHPGPLPQAEGGRGSPSVGVSGTLSRERERVGVGVGLGVRASASQDLTRPPGERPVASPAVRRRAWDMGIELQFVHGSGPAGRITHEDLDVYLATRGQPPAERTAALRQRQGEEAIPVIGLRRRIAQKMQESKRRIPHFSYVEEVDVTEAEALRAQLNARFAAQRGKLTLLPFIARAMVVALDEFPQINARFDDDAGVVTRSHAVHLGVATQTDAGLVVPVIRHAEAQDLWGLARETARLAEAARSGKAARDELSGSTLTLTSLGALGGIASTPVINHPEVAIVGVNRIVQRPMYQGSAVVPRLLMNLSSSFDHRVVDGMDAARFIQAVRALLEQPALLLVE